LDRHTAGFFSSARRLQLPCGTQLGASGQVRGYYLDLRVKATPAAVAAADGFFVGLAQSGLGYYERHLAGDPGDNLAAALEIGRRLVAAQQLEPGPHFGGFEHQFSFVHGQMLRPPWLSAMAQGEAASLLVRLHLETGDEVFAEAALRALEPTRIEVGRGGVAGSLEGRPFLEEYPTDPQSHVLNGAIFALWGLLDVAEGLGVHEWRDAYTEGMDVLAENIDRWNIGYWSRYDLYPHRSLANVASSFYQVLHRNQLEVCGALTGDRRLLAAAASFDRQYASRVARARAFAHKAAFRLLLPRSKPDAA
jgi:hypothetical protein